MSAGTYRCGDFYVDVTNRRFTFRGQEVRIEPRVFAVIAELLARPGELLTREQLLDAVWGHRYVTTSTLSRTVALARRALRDDADNPRYVQTVHGAGYRYIGPIDAEPRELMEPRARFGPPSTARLPARIETLIGREKDLGQLGDLLAGGRIVTVIGTGGMGKTQCALEAARRIADRYPDGVWFFDLVPFERGHDWLQALRVALALPVSDSRSLLERVHDVFRGRRALFVLDNCDRIASEVGAIVFELLRGTDGVDVLATSQSPLSLAGERLLRLSPLGLPARDPQGGFDLATVADAPAVQMLIARVRTVQPDFELTEGNAKAVAEICHRLDGMPLALELAAARFSLLSPEQVLDRLERRFRFLGADVAGRDPRHRNLRALLEWSCALLAAEEQRLLNWCAVFVQTWTVESAVDVGDALGLDAEVVVDLLEGLVNRSLISAVPATMPPRYRLLESVREYGLMQLEAGGEVEAAKRAHVRAMVRLCRAAHEGMLGGRMAEWIDRLARQRDDIAVALSSALESVESSTAAFDILGSLVLYAKAHGDYETVQAWYRTVFQRFPDHEGPECARALLTYGVVQMHLLAADSDAATVLPSAARMAARHGDGWTEAYAEGYLALHHANRRRADEATLHIQVTEAAAHRYEDDLLKGLAGLARGWVYLSCDRPDEASAVLRSVAAVGPDLHQHHFINTYIGLAEFSKGNDAVAAEHWLKGLTQSIYVRNLRGAAGAIEGCGYIACRRGDWREAAKMLAAAARIRERSGIPVFSFWRPHQERALEHLRQRASQADLDAALRAGAGLRPEDAVNEARAMLRSMIDDPTVPDAQGVANRPAGS